jgi:hypothetical protein
MDEFHFSARARGWRKGRLAHRGGALDPRLVVLATGLVVAGVVAFVFLSDADEAPATRPRGLSPDRAYDAAAKGTIGRAVVIAQTLNAERGSFPTDPAPLAAADPSLTFLAGPSDGPTAVSYAAGERGFAAAVRSESGTCWWVRIDPEGAISYGSGSACTGSAAMAASASSW